MPLEPESSHPSGGSQPGISAYTVTFEDVLAGDGISAATGTATSTSSVTYTAVEAGIAGNAIAVISDVQPSVGELTVEVVGTTITLHLETDGASAVLSTFGDVTDALGTSPEAAALISHGAITGSPLVAYEAGDVYLSAGISTVTLASLLEGSIIWDAVAYFPEDFDATTVLVPVVGEDGAPVFNDGPPSTDDADDTSQAGVALSVSAPVFNTDYRLRLTADGDLVVRAESEAGAIPTQGEMLLVVDIRTPA